MHAISPEMLKDTAPSGNWERHADWRFRNLTAVGGKE
jgi:hypothetical protein